MDSRVRQQDRMQSWWLSTNSKRWANSLPRMRTPLPKKQLDYSSTEPLTSMGSQGLWFLIEIQSSLAKSGRSSCDSLEPVWQCHLPTIHRLMGRQNDSTRSWNSCRGLPTRTKQASGTSSYLYWTSHTTMLPTQIWDRHRSFFATDGIPSLHNNLLFLLKSNQHTTSLIL
ncbi:hypothetical protein CLOP_g286 [Closterium sp. NIES-67]|nr:hypothetical protein CLOP_g286 [Closterium sp. NIES-67]